jgi:predicted N-acyltransferase
LYRTINEQQSFATDKDTVRILANCDSLSSQTTAYLLAVDQQDSLQESISSNLTTQLQNRDTIISWKDEQYKWLRQQFDNNLVRQKWLEEQAAADKRKIKRHQLGSKLKSIGIIILSGITLVSMVR